MAKYKAYPEYKDSGVEWLGEIPEHWKFSQVKYGYSITLGKMLQKEKNSYFDSFEPYLKAQNIQVSGLDLHTVDSMWFSREEKKKLLLEYNDILVSEGGDVGRSALWLGQMNQCYIQNAINRVRPQKNNSATFFQYWITFLKSTDFINIICNKATIAHYTVEKLASSPLLLPKKNEQQQIADFLDHETAKIDILIEKQQQLIELLKEKCQAVISHAVTKGLNPDVQMKDSGMEYQQKKPLHWTLNKFRYMFNFDKGLTITKENLQDEGIPCINYGEIHSKYHFEVNTKIHKLKCVNESYLKNNKNSLLYKGDIIFADTSEDIEGAGNFSQLVSSDIVFAGYHTIIARLYNRENYRYYAYLLNSQELRAQIRYSVKGVKVYSITQAILRNISCWLPSSDEQNHIAKYLDQRITKIDILIEKQLLQIDLLKERRTALISAVVTGKIDVRNWHAPSEQSQTTAEMEATV